MVTVLLGAPEAPGLDRGQWSQGFWCSCCQKPRGGFLHGHDGQGGIS